MIKRLFIAINLPASIREGIKEGLREDKLSGIELYQIAQMVPEEDWHITVKFLGDQRSELIDTIERAIRDAMTAGGPPEVTVRTITTAPPNRPPRMIWATTTAPSNQALESIKKAIEHNLAAQGIFEKGEVFPDYRGHITLADLPKGRKITEHIVSLPNALIFKPVTIDLIEANREGTGPKFSVIRSIDFKRSI